MRRNKELNKIVKQYYEDFIKIYPYLTRIEKQHIFNMMLEDTNPQALNGVICESEFFDMMMKEIITIF